MNNTLGQRIKEKRQQLMLSQDEVSSLTGISRSNIGKIENDKINPNCNAILSLSKLFNVSTDWLISGEITKEDISENQNTIDLINKRSYALNESEIKECFAIYDMFLKLPDDEKKYLYGYLKIRTAITEEAIATNRTNKKE